MPALSVVIPAHNEAENLPTLIGEVHAALAALDYEVLVVDDHSSDATPAALARLAAENPRCRFVRHARQGGQSSGLVTGVRNARGEWVATLDGDGQNDPADVAKLWAELSAQGFAPVLMAGWRNKRKDTVVKIISSRIANKVRSSLLGDATPDTGCGLKLFRREDFLRLPQFDHVHRFMPALFQRAGIRTVSVPVNHRPRTRGRSHYGIHNRLWVGLVDLIGVMWLKRRPIISIVEE